MVKSEAHLSLDPKPHVGFCMGFIQPVEDDHGLPSMTEENSQALVQGLWQGRLGSYAFRLFLDVLRFALLLAEGFAIFGKSASSGTGRCVVRVC